MNVKIEKLLTHSEELNGTDLDGAIESAGKAVDLSRKDNLSIELSYSLVRYAICLSEKGEKVAALDSIFEALSLAKESCDEELLFSCSTALGAVYLRLGDLEKAFQEYRKALDSKKATGKKRDLSEAYYGLGTVLFWRENEREAIKYYEKGLAEAAKTHNVTIQLKILNNLGCSHNNLNELDRAEEILQECVTRSRQEKYYYTLISSLDELGVIRDKNGDPDAVNYWLEALDLAERRGDSLVSLGPLFSLANYYFKEGNWEKADHYLNEAKILSEKSGATYDLADLYKLETDFLEGKGDYKKALEIHRKYLELWKEIQKQEELWELKNRELELLAEERDRIETLNEVGRIITSTLDLKKVLYSCYDNLKKILDFSILGIARYDEENREITFDLFIEKEKNYPCITTSPDDRNSLAAWSIRNDKMVMISDYKKESHLYLESWEGRTRLGEGSDEDAPRSILYNPLKIQDRIIGVITIQSYKKNSFRQRDVEAFEILSSYTAIALNNAIQSEEIKKQNEVLSTLATTDSLTGLSNRRYFYDVLNRYHSLAKRRELPVSLIMMDLDYFKTINDRFGHPAGDYVLMEVAELLKKHIKRSYDSAARLGGEEFGLFLGDSDHYGAVLVAEEIKGEIESHSFVFENNVIPVTASLGVVTKCISRESDIGFNEIFRLADNMLYAAKEAGRNCVRAKRYC